MERHIIIIDLDGTLMLDFSHYEEETIDYLKKLHNDGHIILIATGRPLRSSFFVHQAIGLNTPIINYNGALISNPFDDNFPKTDLRVSKDDLAKIFDFAGDNLINVFGEIHDDIYAHSAFTNSAESHFACCKMDNNIIYTILFFRGYNSRYTLKSCQIHGARQENSARCLSPRVSSARSG